jgi:hypothetical protein
MQSFADSEENQTDEDREYYEECNTSVLSMHYHFIP